MRRGSSTSAAVRALPSTPLTRMIQDSTGREVGVQYAPPRKGDVCDSLADIGAAQRAFAFAPCMGMAEGLTEYMAWIRQYPVTARQLEGNG